jgi:hypothetical protein
MITLLADLVFRCVCSPQTAEAARPDLHGWRHTPSVGTLTSKQTALPDAVAHHEWLPPPPPELEPGEPFKESLILLLTELALRRAPRPGTGGQR